MGGYYCVVLCAWLCTCTCTHHATTLIHHHPPHYSNQPQEGEVRIQGLVLPYYTGIIKSGIAAIRGDGAAADTAGVPLDGPKLVQWRQSLGVSDAQVGGWDDRKKDD